MKYIDGERLYSAKDIGHLLGHVFALDTKDILDALQSTQEYHDMLRKRSKELFTRWKPIEPCWDCKAMLPHLESVITPIRRQRGYSPTKECDGE